jgi:hypothetical protein
MAEAEISAGNTVSWQVMSHVVCEKRSVMVIVCLTNCPVVKVIVSHLCKAHQEDPKRKSRQVWGKRCWNIQSRD